MHNLENCTDLQLKSWIKSSPPTYPRSVGGGLCISISETRITAWTFRYRHGGKQKEFTIGRYPDISLSEARKFALSLRNQVNEGTDVALEKKLAKKKQSSVETLNDAVEEHLSNLTNLKHPKVPRQRYDKHVRPVLGNLPLDRISVQHIYDLLKVIRNGKTGVTKPASMRTSDTAIVSSEDGRRLLHYRHTSIYSLPTHLPLKAAVIANSQIVLRRVGSFC